MPAKPCHLIQNTTPHMVEKEYGLIRLSREQGLLEFLGEKLSPLQSHRFKLFPGAHVNEPEFRPPGCRIPRFDPHRKIVLMTGQQMRQHLPRIELRALAQILQALRIRKRTALAPSQMVFRKQSAPRSRQPLQNVPHRQPGMYILSAHSLMVTPVEQTARTDFPLSPWPVPV